jgi:hypothetical protein
MKTSGGEQHWERRRRNRLIGGSDVAWFCENAPRDALDKEPWDSALYSADL